MNIRNAQYLSESTSLVSTFNQIDRILLAILLAGIKIKKLKRARTTITKKAIPQKYWSLFLPSSPLLKFLFAFASF